MKAVLNQKPLRLNREHSYIRTRRMIIIRASLKVFMAIDFICRGFRARENISKMGECFFFSSSMNKPTTCDRLKPTVFLPIVIRTNIYQFLVITQCRLRAHLLSLSNVIPIIFKLIIKT